VRSNPSLAQGVIHDVGGQSDTLMTYDSPEEKDPHTRTYVRGPGLAWCLEPEMRRRAENDLGETLYYGLP
jgi:thiocyanate hydrolase subunit beta